MFVKKAIYKSGGMRGANKRLYDTVLAFELSFSLFCKYKDSRAPNACRLEQANVRRKKPRGSFFL